MTQEGLLNERSGLVFVFRGWGSWAPLRLVASHRTTVDKLSILTAIITILLSVVCKLWNLKWTQIWTPEEVKMGIFFHFQKTRKEMLKLEMKKKKDKTLFPQLRISVRATVMAQLSYPLISCNLKTKTKYFSGSG